MKEYLMPAIELETVETKDIMTASNVIRNCRST